MTRATRDSGPAPELQLNDLLHDPATASGCWLAALPGEVDFLKSSWPQGWQEGAPTFLEKVAQARHLVRCIITWRMSCNSRIYRAKHRLMLCTVRHLICLIPVQASLFWSGVPRENPPEGHSLWKLASTTSGRARRLRIHAIFLTCIDAPPDRVWSLPGQLFAWQLWPLPSFAAPRPSEPQRLPELPVHGPRATL